MLVGRYIYGIDVYIYGIDVELVVCYVSWDICAIMRYLWWMCLIYAILTAWNVYILYLWWMWLLHNKQKIQKKTTSFADCYYPDTRQSDCFPIFWKKALPSAITYTLGKVCNFDECQTCGTRQSSKLRRVPSWQHSAKSKTSLSAQPLALGKLWIFAECFLEGTRQSPRPPSRSPVPFTLFLSSATWHTTKLCRVPEKRHSAKPASPLDETPCALRRELHSAKLLPSVFRPLPSVCGTRQSSRVR